MAIASVRANINGTWYTLTYNSSAGAYQATVTAPGATSFNQPNGYYNVRIEATNTAGTISTADATDFDGLKLRVRETIPPTITILSPTSGAYVSNNKPPVVFNIIDEAGGSGINLSTLSVTQDGTAVASSAIKSTAITNGYSVTYTPASVLSDGKHTITINVKDNDGNAAAAKSTTFTVDTVPPALNISSPTDDFITGAASLTVRGTTNDATSSPVKVTITLNGVSQGEATVDSSGAFSKNITLNQGDNTIVITATDAAGKATSVTRTGVYDASVPVVKSATITPNPADTGATVIISVVVE